MIRTRLSMKGALTLLKVNIVFVAVVLLPSLAHAVPTMGRLNEGLNKNESAIDLVRQCRLAKAGQNGEPLSERGRLDAISCVRYIEGVAEAAFYTLKGQARTNIKICYPSTVSLGTMVNAVIDWSEKHPLVQDKRKINVMILALEEAFPCH